MPKLITRILAFLLVSCLVADPSLAASSSFICPSCNTINVNHFPRLTEDALAVLALGEKQSAMGRLPGQIHTTFGALSSDYATEKKNDWDPASIQSLLDDPFDWKARGRRKA